MIICVLIVILFVGTNLILGGLALRKRKQNEGDSDAVSEIDSALIGVVVSNIQCIALLIIFLYLLASVNMSYVYALHHKILSHRFLRLSELLSDSQLIDYLTSGISQAFGWRFLGTVVDLQVIQGVAQNLLIGILFMFLPTFLNSGE